MAESQRFVFQGRELLLRQLLNEAEFEENSRQFFPAKASTPKLDKRRLPAEKTDSRKRKIDSAEVDNCAASLLEVSRRLDGLLSNSRKMSDDLRKVRNDFDSFEVNLGRVSDDFRMTHSQFRQTARPQEDAEESELVTKVLVAAFGSGSDR